MTGRVLKKAWMRKRPRGLNHSVSRKSSWKERWFELEKETLSYWDRKGGKQNGGTQKGAIELGRVTDVLAGLPDEYGRENVFVVRYTDGDVTGNAAGTREVSLCIQATAAAERNDWLKALIAVLVTRNPAYDDDDADVDGTDANPTGFRSTRSLATERTMPWLRPADADTEYEYSKPVLPIDRWEAEGLYDVLEPYDTFEPPGGGPGSGVYSEPGWAGGTAAAAPPATAEAFDGFGPDGPDGGRYSQLDDALGNGTSRPQNSDAVLERVAHDELGAAKPTAATAPSGAASHQAHSKPTAAPSRPASHNANGLYMSGDTASGGVYDNSDAR